MEKSKFVNIKLHKNIVEGMISTYDCLHHINSDANDRKEINKIIKALKKALEL
jgi:DUF1009 family protein